MSNQLDHDFFGLWNTGHHSGWPTGKGKEWDWELSDMDMGIFYLQLLQAFFGME